jgi:DNA repair protein RadD
MLQFAENRKKWLIFCVSIEHAEHVRDALRENGITAETVSEKTSDGERAQILAALKSGELRAVTNVSVLTTGFDAPVIDMLVLLRPTMSPGLLVQMCGRGMRPLYMAGTDMSTPESRVAGISAGPKPNCLVLDMASNIERHGPVTHIQPKEGVRKKKEDRDGKMCPNCRSIVAITAKECDECHYIFQGVPRTIKHTTRASRNSIMSDVPQITSTPTWFKVDKTTFELHTKPMSPISLKVTYHCGPHKVPEYVCLGHTGYAREKAIQWWSSRGGSLPAPSMASDGLARIHEIAKFRAARINCFLEGKWPRIKSYDLVPAAGDIISEGGNLGSRIVQEPIDVSSTNPAVAEAV